MGDSTLTKMLTNWLSESFVKNFILIMALFPVWLQIQYGGIFLFLDRLQILSELLFLSHSVFLCY